MDDTASVRASWAWLQEIVTDWARWVRGHLLVTVLLSAAAFALGWLWNTYVMAVELQGSQPGGVRTIATAQGETFNALFWLLLFSLLSGLATYAWQRGLRQTLQDLAVLPRRLFEAVGSDMSSTAALLLWGSAVALVTASLITSAVSLALGLVLVTLAATPVGVIVNFAIIRLWRALTGVATPEKDAPAMATTAPFLVMLGEGVGLFVDWGANSWPFSLVAGLLAGGASLVIARRGQGVVAAMFVVGMVSLLSFASGARAWADDGGWSECITEDGEFCSDAGLSGFLAWFGSEGAGTVMAYATIGAVFSAIGAAVGMGFGAVAAAAAGSSVQLDRRGTPAGSADVAGPLAATGGAVSGAADLKAGDAFDRSVGGPTDDPVSSDRERSERDSSYDEEDSGTHGLDTPDPDTPDRHAGPEPESADPESADRDSADRESDQARAEGGEPAAGSGAAHLEAGPADVLPETQARSAADAPGDVGSADLGADIQDVLPEPPEREDEESEEE